MRLFIALFAAAAFAASAAGVAERHEDTLLGTLVRDADTGDWLGATSWSGAKVRVIVDGDDAALLENALATADALWREDAMWDARARHVAADQLLPLYEDTWRDAQDGPELDADAFMQRLVPESVIVAPDGDFEVWYETDDLFGGHAVRVIGSVADGPQAAEISG